MAEQDTSENPPSQPDSEAPDRSAQTDAQAEPARPEDDRNEELEESPVPDPEATGGDAGDDPQAD
jgi:hypothetical protein